MKNKTLITAIIISLILGGSLLGYGYLNYKYRKEALEQKTLQDTKALLQKQENEKKDYTAKRKAECYDIEQRERKTFTNVESSFYNEIQDTCYVHYKTNDYVNYTEEDCKKEFGEFTPAELDCELGQFYKTF